MTRSRCVLSEDVEEKHLPSLKVLATIVDEIARVDMKFVNVTGV